MATLPKRRAIALDDDENHRLHASWSRSGKRLMVTVAKTTTWSESRYVELRPEQVEKLIQFLTETLASDAANR